jgi:hypothetical protein
VKLPLKIHPVIMPASKSLIIPAGLVSRRTQKEKLGES